MCRVSSSPMWRPGLAGVDGLIHPIAVRNISAPAGFARADVDHIRIRRSHGNRADGHDSRLVRHRRPGEAAIGRFPNAAGNRSEIISLRIAGDARYCERASAAKRTDLAPLHCLQCIFIERLRTQSRASQSNQKHRQQERNKLSSNVSDHSSSSPPKAFVCTSTTAGSIPRGRMVHPAPQSAPKTV